MFFSYKFKLLSFFIISNFFFFQSIFADDQSASNTENQSYIGEKVFSEDSYVQQNLFNSTYLEKMNDHVSILFSPEFLLSNMGGVTNYSISAGLMLDINHIFRYGFMYNYMLMPSSFESKKQTELSKINSIKLNSFYYVANSFFITPLSQYIFHPNFGLYAGFGQTNYSLLNLQGGTINSSDESFLIWIPTLELELNVIRNVLASFSFGYRFISPIDGEVHGLNAAQLGLKATIVFP